MLHAIVAHGGEPEVTYEIRDSVELGPLGMPLSTSVAFSAEREGPEALATEVAEAIERAGLADRFERPD
ncbi:MAG: hypothetical protein GEU88_14500 [Solirubrobacterales bacterium]|nr:hypothetical protein [Solirubrobacterales bacterium]